MATIKKRGDAYHLIWYEAGKHHFKSLGRVDHRTAKDAARDKEIEIARRRGRPVENGIESIDSLIERYLLHSKTHKKPDSYERDALTYRTLRKTFPNVNTIEQYTPMLIDEYKSRRVEAGLKPQSVNRELCCIKAMFTQAERWCIIGKSPAKGIKKVMHGDAHPRYLSLDEIKTLIDDTSGVWRDMVMIAVYTGFRLQECINLCWRDVTETTISVTGKNGWTPKTHEERTIPLHPSLKAYLLGKKHDGEYVLGQYRPTKLVASKYFGKIFKRNKIKEASFHTLRHTFASHLVMGIPDKKIDGVDLYTLSKFLGHKSVITTQRYAHLSKDHLQNAIQKLPY